MRAVGREMAAQLPEAQQKIVREAKKQAREQTVYNADYVSLKYPGGDVPRKQGSCTDVVIRSLRAAGYDLQKLVHDDASAHLAAYRRIARLDKNIDHRRCPNLVAYFARHGKKLTNDPKELDQWKPGDFVFWKLPNGLDHTGVISDLKRTDGVPFTIHNISVCREEDALTEWTIVGHYRFP